VRRRSPGNRCSGRPASRPSHHSDEEIPTARSDDHSTGDRRAPYSDQGGTQGRHAQTHDVKREAETNSPPQVDEVDEFADDLANDKR
jgi:hypothetical protein